eukprot:Lankesteria_metandrocarpae@DN5438_c0_g5_i1.p1
MLYSLAAQAAALPSPKKATPLSTKRDAAMLLPDSLADQAAALRSPKDSIVDFLETLFPHDIEYAKWLLDTVQRFLIGSETGVECNVSSKDNNISFACRGGITKV